MDLRDVCSPLVDTYSYVALSPTNLVEFEKPIYIYPIPSLAVPTHTVFLPLSPPPYPLFADSPC